MALPTNPAQQKILYPVVVPNMANQVTFEGFLARAWTHNNFRYLRLANHRAPQAGAQSDGPMTVESDYVTVRLDPSVLFDMNRATEGLRLMVRGRIEGHDIPETIGDILRHCNLNVRIPQDISHLTVTRPAVQIFCTFLEFRRETTGNNKQQRPGRHSKNHRRNGRRPFRQHPNANVGKDAQAPQAVVGRPTPAMSMKDATPAREGVQPGRDISEVAAAIDARKVPTKGKKAEAPADQVETPKKSLLGRKVPAKKAAKAKKGTDKKTK